jgi:hypothetical protein
LNFKQIDFDGFGMVTVFLSVHVAIECFFLMDWIEFFFFLYQFCDVAKLVIIQKKI